MRLPYDKIFLDGGGAGDSEIVACGFSASYMRLLLSAAGDYFSFYDGEDRVELSDAESQIIESGREELTRLFIEGGCSDMRLAFSGYLPTLLDFGSGQTTNIPFTPSIIDSEYLSWDVATRRLNVLSPCQLLLTGQSRVDSEQQAGSFNQIMAIRKNGGALGIAQDIRQGSLDTLNASAADNFLAGDYITMTYYNNQGDLVFLRALECRLWAVRVG